MFLFGSRLLFDTSSDVPTYFQTRAGPVCLLLVSHIARGLVLHLFLCTDLIAYVGKWSFISELANIYIKENTRRCPLCIDLLFLSLKMKLWHVTKTSLDFAKIPLCTRWIRLRAQAAPSPRSLQRHREQLQLPQPDLLTPLPLEPPTAAGVAVSQTCGGSRRRNSAARAAWTEMGAACGKGRSIQLAFFTFLLSFSSVES